MLLLQKLSRYLRPEVIAIREFQPNNSKYTGQKEPMTTKEQKHESYFSNLEKGGFWLS
tara:strand:+ start:4157 stop:4330 length:174 start_codon:yes stop_codon:yes gene_type:complete